MFDIHIHTGIGIGVDIVIHKSFGIFLLLLDIVSTATALFRSIGFLRGWIGTTLVMAVGIGWEDVGFVR